MRCLFLASALFVPAAAAQQPSPADAQPAEAREVLEIGRAAEMALTARSERDASALVDAAELLLEYPSMEARFSDTPEEAEPAPASLEPRILLSEAARLGGEDAALAGRIAAVRALMPDQKKSSPAVGAESGPLRYSASVAAGAVRRHELPFAGPGSAVIQVRGVASANLDVLLFDVNGDRVAADQGTGNVATLHWYVPYTQTLTLVVRNRGARSSGYYVITN